MEYSDSGMGENRPPLTVTLPVEDFRQFYWLKKELETFCRSNGLSTSGGKIAIATRIETFLATGQVEQPRASVARRQPIADDLALSLDTVIQAGFICTQRHRVFFKAVIGPKFHFSTFIQNFFKANVGQTYRDAVRAWHEEEARKKDPQHTTTIAPQFEYNQFTRDFFNDPKNTGQPRDKAIRAWKIKRRQPGANTYSPDDTYDE